MISMRAKCGDVQSLHNAGSSCRPNDSLIVPFASLMSSRWTSSLHRATWLGTDRGSSAPRSAIAIMSCWLTYGDEVDSHSSSSRRREMRAADDAAHNRRRVDRDRNRSDHRLRAHPLPASAAPRTLPPEVASLNDSAFSSTTVPRAVKAAAATALRLVVCRRCGRSSSPPSRRAIIVTVAAGSNRGAALSVIEMDTGQMTS
mmetsp:Transcript_30165/g.89730  ORF Transcript_30165/g.89730 Transcript_30165/m.89730 type:complete len:201 (+) Transcript_30165:2708-3310(+)